jgi:hypothetical protein
LADLHFILYLQAFHAVLPPAFQKSLQPPSTPDNIAIVVIVVIAFITFPNIQKAECEAGCFADLQNTNRSAGFPLHH